MIKMMKKKSYITLLILCTALFFTGCGSYRGTQPLDDTYINGRIPETAVKADAVCAVPEQPIEPEYFVYTDIEEAKRVLAVKSDEVDAIVPYYYDSAAYAELTALRDEAVSAMESANADVLSERIHALSLAIEGLPIARGMIPRVYLSFDESKVNRNDYIPLSVLFSDSKDSDTAPLWVDEASIVIRGNSTSSGAKKPYNIKLSDGDEVFGLPSGKKWCLLAECYDKTLVRNSLAFYLGHSFGLVDTPSYRHVDVYVNGAYRGVYLLCTPISDGRLKLDKKENAYLFETEASRYEADKSFYVTPGFGIRFMVKYPEPLPQNDKKTLDSFFSEMEGALRKKDLERLSRYIDVGSFVNTFILYELMKPVDFTYSSVHYTMYDGILRAGPIWDFDLSSGNASTAIEYEGYKRYNNLPGWGGDDSADSARGFWAVGHWYDALRDIPEFMELVKERYMELQPVIVNLYSDNSLGASLISEIYEEYGEAFNANYEDGGWSVSVPYSYYERTYPNADYEGNLEFLRAWLQRRNEWLLTQWGS